VRLAVLTFGLALLACGCRGGDASGEQGGSGLRVTREDGSQVKLPDELHAWCGPGPVAPQAEHERAPTPPKPMELWIVGGLPEERAEEADTLWMFSWPTKAVERSPTIKLPDEGEALHAALFVYDSATENELSSSGEKAKGTVEVVKWGCEKGDKVRLAIDATLDSEFFQEPTVDAEGEVEAVIGDPLTIPD
jgi:hypothetical protein